MSRTRRFLGGVGFGYLNMAITTIAGLFLTRFFLSWLGQREYGYWLIATQVVGYALLLDLGIVALLPREIAFATGRAGGLLGTGELPAIIGRTARLVRWQLPLLLVGLVPFWVFLPADWEPLRWPLALVLATFVTLFPLRLYQATLNGLQDLSFLAAAQLVAWLVNTAATVGLLLGGWRLLAFAAGYALSQLSLALACLLRLKSRYPGVLPKRLPRVSLASALPYAKKAGWASVIQIANVFVLGTDLLVLGALFGPEVVVSYALTAKLFQVLGNQPGLLMQVAAPGLSELHTAENTAGRRFAVVAALGQAMLTGTGAIVVAVTAVNEGFVTWWVGAERYGGFALTMAFAAQLLVRHWNTTLVYVAFSFGRERRIAVTAILDGLVSVIGSILFGRWLGPVGVPLGPIVGAVLVSAPWNVAAIAAETNVAWYRVTTAHAWWMWRLVPLAALSVAMAKAWAPRGLAGLSLETATIAAIYVAGMASAVLRPPLGDYVRPRLAAAVERVARRNAA